MSSIIISCKDCKERHIGCHADCEKYLQEKELYEAVKKKMQMDHIADVVLASNTRNRNAVLVKKYGTYKV